METATRYFMCTRKKFFYTKKTAQEAARRSKRTKEKRLRAMKSKPFEKGK